MFLGNILHKIIPRWHLLNASQQWKHKKNVWNLFKVKYKYTRGMSMTSFRPYYCWLWASKCRLNFLIYLIIDLFAVNQLHFMKLSMRGKPGAKCFCSIIFCIWTFRIQPMHWKISNWKTLNSSFFLQGVISSEIISSRKVTWFSFLKQSSMSCLEKVLNILCKCQKIHLHHLLNFYF